MFELEDTGQAIMAVLVAGVGHRVLEHLLLVTGVQYRPMHGGFRGGVPTEFARQVVGLAPLQAVAWRVIEANECIAIDIESRPAQVAHRDLRVPARSADNYAEVLCQLGFAPEAVVTFLVAGLEARGVRHAVVGTVEIQAVVGEGFVPVGVGVAVVQLARLTAAPTARCRLYHTAGKAAVAGGNVRVVNFQAIDQAAVQVEPLFAGGARGHGYAVAGIDRIQVIVHTHAIEAEQALIGA
ncbi:hypothetical protein D3C77_317070 [compost metagenome]